MTFSNRDKAWVAGVLAALFIYVADGGLTHFVLADLVEAIIGGGVTGVATYYKKNGESNVETGGIPEKTTDPNR